MDVVSPEKRSLMMANIRNRDTKPELLIRRSLHGMGFRYRVNKRTLPGAPDIYLKKFNCVILVNGCFWHGHTCKYFKWPKTNTAFWKKKISDNVVRDNRNIAELQSLSLRVLVVWECVTRDKNSFVALMTKIVDFIYSNDQYKELM